MRMSIWVVKILSLKRSAISLMVTQTCRLGIVISLIVIQILTYIGGDELPDCARHISSNAPPQKNLPNF